MIFGDLGKSRSSWTCSLMLNSVPLAIASNEKPITLIRIFKPLT